MAPASPDALRLHGQRMTLELEVSQVIAYVVPVLGPEWHCTQYLCREGKNFLLYSLRFSDRGTENWTSKREIHMRKSFFTMYEYGGLQRKKKTGKSR